MGRNLQGKHAVPCNKKSHQDCKASQPEHEPKQDMHGPTRGSPEDFGKHHSTDSNHGVAKRCKRRKWSSEVEPCHPATVDPLEGIEISDPGWWQPQPHASMDPMQVEQRPSWPLARLLSCCLCNDLLKEAITAPECGHSFCYDCIMHKDHVTIGGAHNVCPVPNCHVLLGPNPFEHVKLKYDCVLDSLVSKVFPRTALDAALQARRSEREQATREAKAMLSTHRGLQALDEDESIDDDVPATAPHATAAAAPKAVAHEGRREAGVGRQQPLARCHKAARNKHGSSGNNIRSSQASTDGSSGNKSHRGNSSRLTRSKQGNDQG